MNENPPPIDHALETYRGRLPRGTPERYEGIHGDFRRQMDDLFGGMKPHAPEVKKQKPTVEKIKKEVGQLAKDFKTLSSPQRKKKPPQEKNVKIQFLAMGIAEDLRALKGEYFEKYQQGLVQAANPRELEALQKLWENLEQNHQELSGRISLAMSQYVELLNFNLDEESKTKLKKETSELISSLAFWEEAVAALTKNIAMYYSGRNS